MSINDINILLCNKIKEITGCVVIKSNISGHTPDYPYISFTVTSRGGNSGRYGCTGSTYRKQVKVRYSWTVQSNSDSQAETIADTLHDWFELTGYQFFRDNGIGIASVEDITNRDNLITIQYEYRKGFDTEFNVMHEIDASTDEIIENASIARK